LDGDRREIWKNIETRTLSITILLTFLIVVIGLSQVGSYPRALIMFRKGFYQLISAHTTTGYMTIYARQFIDEWGALRWWVNNRYGLRRRRLFYCGRHQDAAPGRHSGSAQAGRKKNYPPERAVVEQRLHHLKEMFLEDKQVRAALLITVSY